MVKNFAGSYKKIKYLKKNQKTRAYWKKYLNIWK